MKNIVVVFALALLLFSPLIINADEQVREKAVREGKEVPVTKEEKKEEDVTPRAEYDPWREIAEWSDEVHKMFEDFERPFARSGWNPLNWDAFRDFYALRSGIDRLLGRQQEKEPSGAIQRPERRGFAWAPTVDIAETENEYTVHAELPGVKPDDIAVEVNDNLLTLSGHREQTSEEKGKTWRRRERNYGSFKRTFTLPQNANVEDIKATYDHGVLNIKIGKTSTPSTRKIEVVHTK
jgi:HSP20 family protein